MPHVPAPENVPGIVGLFAYRPETAKPLRELAETLLRKDSPLSRSDRETIAYYVSWLNECRFCSKSHGAIALAYLKTDHNYLAQIRNNYQTAPISEKLKTLLAIAEKVQKKAKTVSPDDIKKAKASGATDVEIHDAVLIAAAFCMYNRYVDGLAALSPESDEAYTGMGIEIAEKGYLRA